MKISVAYIHVSCKKAYMLLEQQAAELSAADLAPGPPADPRVAARPAEAAVKPGEAAGKPPQDPRIARSAEAERKSGEAAGKPPQDPRIARSAEAEGKPGEAVRMLPEGMAPRDPRAFLLQQQQQV